MCTLYFNKIAMMNVMVKLSSCTLCKFMFLYRVGHGKNKEQIKKVTVIRMLKIMSRKTEIGIETGTVTETVTGTVIEIVTAAKAATEIVIGTEGEIGIEIVIVTRDVTGTETIETEIETEIVVVTEIEIAGRIRNEMIKISPDDPAAGELRVL